MSDRSDRGGSKLGDLLAALVLGIVLLMVVAMVLEKVVNVLLIGTAIILGAILLFKLLLPRHFDEFVARKSLGEHYLPPHERREMQRGDRRREIPPARDADNVIRFDRKLDDPTQRRKNEQLNRRLSDTVRRSQKRRKKPGGRSDRPPRLFD